MNRLGLLLLGALVSCAGGIRQPGEAPPKTPNLLDSSFIRISYFRFDEFTGPEGPERGASAWVVFSRSWANVRGQQVVEPYIKAFPRAKAGVQNRQKGIVVATGVYPDEELRGYVREFINRGFLKLPATPMSNLTRERTLGLFGDRVRGRFYRVMSIATDQGSWTVVLEPLVPNSAIDPVPAVARTFVEVETYLASVVSRLAIATETGVGRD
ncbi:MAG TPA: hypothetical protein VI643_06030 [Planctomycetota bacterium]|nr:hypothetical protein [Planctomycetota bacterium]